MGAGPLRWRPWALVLALAVPLLPMVATNATADSVESVGALPVETSHAPAVWDGTNAYLFGGSTGDINSPVGTIVRYDPSTNTAVPMGAVLPTGRALPSAVWTGSKAYIFGGYDGSAALGEILRYDPATDTVAAMSATLPFGVFGASAIWDGTNAYLFSGYTTDRIFRYNPATDTVTTMGTTLPKARYGADAWWDGSHAYILGGQWGAEHQGAILRYHPGTDTLTTMGAAMPTARSHGATVWDGTNAYFFGGYGESVSYSSEILRYDPAADQATVMHGTLPTEQFLSASGVWTGSDIYLFGGRDEDGPSAEILRYRLNPGPPQSPSAAAGPGLGDITVSWQAPPSNSHLSAITGYEVYRGTASGGETLVTAGGCSSVGLALTCTDSGFGNGATRFYKVRALNAAGAGEFTATLPATTFSAPSAPRNLLAVPDTEGTTLSWEAPANVGGLTVTYLMYRGPSSGGKSLLTDGGCSAIGTALTCKDTGCPTLGTCYYQVRATNLAGAGPLSNEAVAPGSRVPWETVEAALCANENPNLLSEGHCDGGDYTLPTLEDILSDVLWLLTGERP